MMKILIASDIHGSAKYCRALLEQYERENAGRLLLLGDLLYHGPRNDLPEAYDPKQVIALLNGLSDQIYAVRGNCEAEVDQMMLDFPVMAEYAALFVDGRVLCATHGHRFGEDNPPPLAPGDFLLCGHTHVPACRRREGFTYLNPGSVSIPKGGAPHGYCLLEDGLMTWLDLKSGGAFDRQRLW